MRKGKITPNGVILQAHEMATVVFLTECGLNIELVQKSNKAGAKSPDIKIGKSFWEMKSPKVSGKSLMKNTLQKAASQAENVIVDLRRVKRHETKCLAELKREFQFNKRLKHIKVITKTNKMLDFTK